MLTFSFVFTRLLYSFRTSLRRPCPLTCAVGHAATFAVNAALVASQCQQRAFTFPCTLPFTLSTRLDRQYRFSSRRSDPTGNRTQPTSICGARSFQIGRDRKPPALRARTRTTEPPCPSVSNDRDAFFL